MSEVSELTDLEEDEDYEEGPSLTRSGRTKARASDTNTGYKIRGALKVPRATTYTCQSLHDQISAHDIDLQPEYQRDVVWPESKQIGLIDSIFRNFYVPPVIFVVQSTDEGEERRVCVDGKQRLTSIYRFIAGEIPYKDAFTGEKFVFKDTGNIKAQILPEKYKKLFLNKQIVCMEYTDITPDNEREIFQRVQLGMALTPAEKLQAITGLQADFVRQLMDTYVADQLAANLSWDTSRANDFRVLSTAVYSMSRWPHLTTLPSLSTIQSWLQESEDLDDDFCEDVHDTFRIFCALAKDDTLNKCFWIKGIKKVAPMEVVAICILIHGFKKKMSMGQLSEAIGLMRTDVRKTEKDVRQNTRTFKIIITFLKNLKPTQLKSTSDQPAAREQPQGKRKRGAGTPAERPPESKKSKQAATPAPANAGSSSSQSPVVPAAAPKPIPAKPLPTGPRALNLPPRPSFPAPPVLPPLRNNELGDALMARMVPSQTSSSSFNGMGQGQHRSPSIGGSGGSWTRR